MIVLSFFGVLFLMLVFIIVGTILKVIFSGASWIIWKFLSMIACMIVMGIVLYTLFTVVCGL